MNREEIINEAIKIVNSDNLTHGDKADAIEMISLIMANTLGFLVVAKLRKCDCDACRHNCELVIEEVMDNTRIAIRTAINNNLKTLGIAPFGASTHNQVVAKEILDELNG